jgi:hypothetical protein
VPPYSQRAEDVRVVVLMSISTSPMEMSRSLSSISSTVERRQPLVERPSTCMFMREATRIFIMSCSSRRRSLNVNLMSMVSTLSPNSMTTVMPKEKSLMLESPSPTPARTL